MGRSLETLQAETYSQAGFHLTLAQQIRTEIEMQASTFCVRQLHHKKDHQTRLANEFKRKHVQETFVTQAREKFEADCIRINSYTAQSSFARGKDLDKITLKLERAQQMVRVNERDFVNFARALRETTLKWQDEWRAFCDSCQDMELERLEFMKKNMWTYASALLTACAADDRVRSRFLFDLTRASPHLLTVMREDAPCPRSHSAPKRAR